MSIMMMTLMDLFVTFTFFFSGVCSPYWWDCCTYWIGATDVTVNGTFLWTSDNSTLGFVKWYPGEPSDTNEHCATICRDEHWNNGKCDDVLSYICKTPAL